MNKQVEQIDFEQELYKAFGQVKNFTIGMRIARWFYDMGRNSQEPSKVWHDASELPTKKFPILVVDAIGEGMVCNVDTLAFEHFAEYNNDKWAYLDDLLNIQEEPVSKDLEKVAEKYANTDYNYFNELVTEYDGTEHWIDDKAFVEEAFKAGAQWKEQQMIDKACDLLSRMVCDITYKDLQGDSTEHYDTTEFVEDFRKAMSNIKED